MIKRINKFKIGDKVIIGYLEPVPEGDCSNDGLEIGLIGRVIEDSSMPFVEFSNGKVRPMREHELEVL